MAYPCWWLIMNYYCFLCYMDLIGPGASIWLISAVSRAHFFHLNKSGQHLPASVLQALPLTKVSPRPGQVLESGSLNLHKMTQKSSNQTFKYSPKDCFILAPSAGSLFHYEPLFLTLLPWEHCPWRGKMGSKEELRSFAPGCHQPHHITRPKS